MSQFLRSVYNGAIAAGWEPVDHRQYQGLPPQALVFRRPGGKKGVCFALPEHAMSMDEMMAASHWCLPQGLRVVWFVDYDRFPLWHKHEVPVVFLVMEGHVQPAQKGMVPISVFVEMALQGWFRFSDERKRWVWSDPKTDPEAIKKKKHQDRLAQRAARQAADLMRER